MKMKITSVMFISVCACIILYFTPVDIALNPRETSLPVNGNGLTVLVSNINIFKISISQAQVDNAIVEPGILASAEKSNQTGEINIHFLKHGNGKLVVKSDGRTKELNIISTIPFTQPPEIVKAPSKLRVLYNKYKHVEKIYLRDGTIMLGVMYEKQNVINFITPDGTLNISKDDIVRVEYLKPDTI